MVRPIQSRLLRERLEEYDVPVEEILVHHAGHELVAQGGPINPDLATVTAAIVDFLVKTLK